MADMVCVYLLDVVMCDTCTLCGMPSDLSGAVPAAPKSAPCGWKGAMNLLLSLLHRLSIGIDPTRGAGM